MSSDPVPYKAAAAPIAFGHRGVELTTFEDAFRFATAIHKSGLAPAGLTSPEAILIALQAGLELGFSPMRALSAVVVVNGRPSLMGEAALAKIRQSGVCEYGPEVGTVGDGDKREGVCTFRRATGDVIVVKFTIADAKRAGLWGKGGPWTQYPDDMLMWRAVARACKRYFSDVLLGLVLTEEMQDYPVTTAANVAHELRAPERDPLLDTAMDAEVVDHEREDSPEALVPPGAPAQAGMAAGPVPEHSPDTAPAQETGQEAPRETPLPSTPEPVITQSVPWNPRGACPKCGRHKIHANDIGHGTFDGGPCPYTGLR